MQSRYEFSKRILDLLLVLILIIPSIILIIVFATILFLQYKSNPFFVQERGISLSKARLKIIKLRTIKSDTSKVNSVNDIFFKDSLKNQISTFAEWLRKTGLDELPQIINVIFGSMSFIGPRPLMDQDLEVIKKENPILYYKRESLDAKPGISGLWQIYGNREEKLSNLLALDMIYNTYKTINIDIQLMIKSIFFVINGKNSDAIFSINKKEKTYINIAIDDNVEFKMDSDLVRLFALPLLKSSKKYSYSLNVPNNFWTTDFTLSQSTAEESGADRKDKLSA